MSAARLRLPGACPDRFIVSFVAACMVMLATACNNAASDAEGRRLPTDAQVVADVTPADKENVVDVRTVEDRAGESYLHRNDLVWTYDRGVVIRRDAQLPELPDAVVVVGGLARYQLVGDEYVFRRFVTSYNEYEGIPAPSTGELKRFVTRHINKVFEGREHYVLSIQSVDAQLEQGLLWHNPNSLTAAFVIRYRLRRNNTTVEDRAGTFDIRFYRTAIDQPLNNLLATETGRSVLGTETLEATALDGMPTLRSNFE